MFDTKNNHYVPKSYLENFASGNLYKLLKSNKKIFPISNFTSECSKTHLYTVKEKISDNLVTIVCKILKLNDIGISIAKNLQMFLNGDFNNYLSITINEDNPEAQREIERIISNLQTFMHESKTQEELFSLFYEDGFFKFLNKIKNDISQIDNILTNNIIDKQECAAYYILKYETIYSKFYTKLLGQELQYENKDDDIKNLISQINKESIDNEYFNDILLYLFIQHYRTKSFIDSFKKTINENLEEEMRNFIFLALHILSLLQAIEYSMEPQKVCYIVENKTTSKFITSDNPSCFLYSNNALTIIMPLNENQIIIFSNKKSHVNKKTNIHYYTCNNTKFIDYINKITYKYADKCLYGEKLVLQNL